MATEQQEATRRRLWEVARALQGKHMSAGPLPISRRVACSVVGGHDFFWTGHLDSMISMWDATLGTLKATFEGAHLSAVRSLAVSPNKPHHLFSSARLDPQVVCWDVESGRIVRTFNRNASAGSGFGFAHLALETSLNILVAAASDHPAHCYIWDPRTPDPHILTLPGPTCSLVTSPFQPHVLTGSVDSRVKLWDLARPDSPCATLSSGYRSASLSSGYRCRVEALAMPPESRSVACAFLGGIKTFSLPEGHLCHSYPLKSAATNLLAINEDHVMVSVPDLLGTGLQFWDYETGQFFQYHDPGYDKEDMEACLLGFRALSFNSNGSRLLTCQENGAITMWKEQDDYDH